MYFNNDIWIYDNLTNDLFNKISNKEFLTIAYLGANSRFGYIKVAILKNHLEMKLINETVFSNPIKTNFLGLIIISLSNFGMSHIH